MYMSVRRRSIAAHTCTCGADVGALRPVHVPECQTAVHCDTYMYLGVRCRYIAANTCTWVSDVGTLSSHMYLVVRRRYIAAHTCTCVSDVDPLRPVHVPGCQTSVHCGLYMYLSARRRCIAANTCTCVPFMIFMPLCSAAFVTSVEIIESNVLRT